MVGSADSCSGYHRSNCSPSFCHGFTRTQPPSTTTPQILEGCKCAKPRAHARLTYSSPNLKKDKVNQSPTARARGVGTVGADVIELRPRAPDKRGHPCTPTATRTTHSHPSPLPNPTPLPMSAKPSPHFRGCGFCIQLCVSFWDRGKGLFVAPLRFSKAGNPVLRRANPRRIGGHYQRARSKPPSVFAIQNEF